MEDESFDTIKNKVSKCTDATQLCAAIYPWILSLVCKYADRENTYCLINSFRMEVDDFSQVLSKYILAIPSIVSPESLPWDCERIRGETLDAAISMAVRIANIEVSQCRINLSSIMAQRKKINSLQHLKFLVCVQHYGIHTHFYMKPEVTISHTILDGN